MSDPELQNRLAALWLAGYACAVVFTLYSAVRLLWPHRARLRRALWATGAVLGLVLLVSLPFPMFGMLVAAVALGSFLIVSPIILLLLSGAACAWLWHRHSPRPVAWLLAQGACFAYFVATHLLYFKRLTLPNYWL